jgi:hypothetical protein
MIPEEQSQVENGSPPVTAALASCFWRMTGQEPFECFVLEDLLQKLQAVGFSRAAGCSAALLWCR